MLFNHLLLSGCLLPGKTSHKEDGVEVSLQSNGETVLFFHIDEKSNPNCKFRELLGLDHNSLHHNYVNLFYSQNT
jgi:hypothetical protein